MQISSIKWDEKTQLPANKRAVLVDSSFPMRKRKFMVDTAITLGDFMQILRKYTKISARSALFLFHNRRLLPMAMKFGEFAEAVVKVTLAKENTFG